MSEGDHGNKKLFLSSDKWEEIHEVLECLKPAKIAMKQLQNENLTLTDIYKFYNMCHLSIADFGRFINNYELSIKPVIE